jgi:hypothetical protein
VRYSAPSASVSIKKNNLCNRSNHYVCLPGGIRWRSFVAVPGRIGSPMKSALLQWRPRAQGIQSGQSWCSHFCSSGGAGRLRASGKMIAVYLLESQTHFPANSFAGKNTSVFSAWGPGSPATASSARAGFAASGRIPFPRAISN